MGMCRFIGLLAVIPATMFLMVSFFVLFAVSKVDTLGLKKFGKVISVLLWICSALVLSAGISSIFLCGKCCGPMGMHHKGMCMEGRESRIMDKDEMSGEMDKDMPECHRMAPGKTK
jgi:hypothetical protein